MQQQPRHNRQPLRPKWTHQSAAAVAVGWAVAISHAQPDGNEALFTKLNDVVVSPWNQAFARAMSGDGSTVVGIGRQSSGGWTGAFRWRRDSGFSWITDVYPQSNDLRFLSFDGRVIGGHRLYAHPTIGTLIEPTRWTDLNPEFVGRRTTVAAMSGDGQTLVLNGLASYSAEQGTVTIWRVGQELEVIFGPSSLNRRAMATNPECSVIAGQMDNDLFRWTRNDGVQRVVIPSGAEFGVVNAMSSDGSIMTGHIYSEQEQAYRWTSTDGFQLLGALPGLRATVATAMSADGRIILGFAHASYGAFAPFLWTRPTGMIRLQSVLSPFNLELDGPTVKRADAISRDGGVVLITDEASWHCVLPCPFAIGPASTLTTCRRASLEVEIVSTGSCDVSFQWRRNGIILIDGEATQGVTTQTLTLMHPTAADEGMYDCVISTSTRTHVTAQCAVHVCIADYTCDGGIDGADVFAFFADWEAGEGLSDVNDDGGVDGADVGVFFERWENGC